MSASSQATRLSWQDYSFEYKGFFAYNAAVMVMFITGLLPVAYEFAVAAGILVVLTMISLIRRSRMNWHRPPLSPSDMAKALGSLLLMTIMAGVAISQFPPANPHFAAWILAVCGIAIFNTSRQLKLVALSEAAFRDGASGDTASGEGEPRWHAIVRGLYTAAFVALWLTFMAFFYVDGVAIKNGSRYPTATLTEVLQNHGAVVYVSRLEADRVNLLQTISMMGIPIVIVTGLLLHFGLRVRIFDNGVRVLDKHYD